MIIRVIDFETTGIPSETEKHAIVEIGWTDMHRLDGGGFEIGKTRSELVNPGRPIPVEAMAVHHIRDRELVGAISPDAACARLSAGADMWCAHNAEFEAQFFGGDPLICTYKAALRVWPDAPGHSLQVLRYWRRYDDFVSANAMPPHRAGADTYLTAFLLRELLEHATLEEIAKWSSGPALLAKCGFGKHFGKKWSEVPRDYLSWIVNKSDITDRNVRATAKFYLGGGRT